MIALSLIAATSWVSTIHAFVVVTPSRVTTVAPVHLFGRFRKKKRLTVPDPIAVGQPIPDVDVEMLTVNSTIEGDAQLTTVPVTASELFSQHRQGKKSILVGMPGAFTPVCTSEHLPGFIQAANKLRSLGVDTVAVVTTNDQFVNQEWATQAGLLSQSTDNPAVTILSDGDAALVTQLGLVEDMGFGMGVRSKRFALVLEDGVVSEVLVEEDASGGMETCELTSAENLIRLLTPPELELEETDTKPVVLALGAGVALAVAFMLMKSGDVGGDASEFTLLNTFGK